MKEKLPNQTSLELEILGLIKKIEISEQLKKYPEFEKHGKLLLRSLENITKFDTNENGFEAGVRNFYILYLEVWLQATKFDKENKNFEGQNPMLGSKFQDYFLTQNFKGILNTLLNMVGGEEKFSYLKQVYQEKLKDL